MGIKKKKKQARKKKISFGVEKQFQELETVWLSSENGFCGGSPNLRSFPMKESKEGKHIV